MPAEPDQAVADEDSRRGHAQVRLLCGLLLTVVLLQRIAIPLGGTNQLPLLLLTSLTVAGFGVVSGLLQWDSRRCAFVLFALAACTVTGVLALVRGSVDASVLSLGYLLPTYAIFMVVLRDPPRWVLSACLRFLSGLGAGIGVISVVQVAVQPLGLGYSDLLADVLPAGYLLTGFHTSYPIVYGSSLYKANALVFLEPSFCSQFLGISFLAGMLSGAPRRYLIAMAAGIVCTLAGTGMVIVVIGLVVLTAQNGARRLRALVVPVVIALLVAFTTPLGSVLATRIGETGQADSSGSLRFVQPFQVLGGAWLDHVSGMLLGAGPGASERLAIRLSGSTALQQPVPLKLAVDYGAPAAVVFLVCLLWVMIASAPLPAVTAALVASWLILNSALLLPVVVILLWTLGSLVSTARFRAADA